MMDFEVVGRLNNHLAACIGAQVDRVVVLRLDVDIVEQLQGQGLDVKLVKRNVAGNQVHKPTIGSMVGERAAIVGEPLPATALINGLVGYISVKRLGGAIQTVAFCIQLHQHCFTHRNVCINRGIRIGSDHIIGADLGPVTATEVRVPQVDVCLVRACVLVDLVVHTNDIIGRCICHCDFALIGDVFEIGSRIIDGNQIGFAADTAFLTNDNITTAVCLGAGNDVDFIGGDIGKLGAVRIDRAVAELRMGIKGFHQPR